MADDPATQRPEDGDTGGQPDPVASDMVSGSTGDEPNRRTGEFTPAILDRTVIALPLLKDIRDETNERLKDLNKKRRIFPVIIDLNNEFRGEGDARRRVEALVKEAITNAGEQPQSGIDENKSDLSDQYVFARLEGPVIQELARLDNVDRPEVGSDAPGGITGHRAIHSIWPDFPVKALLNKSHVTVKADAAWSAFTALGEGIVWGVLDSGIDQHHPHFKEHQNLGHAGRLAEAHRDFSGSAGGALVDEFGHGTHVAGIIAGGMSSPAPGAVPPPRRKGRTAAAKAQPEPPTIMAYSRFRDEHDNVRRVKIRLDKISGIAPKSKLLSLKVLDDQGQGEASNLIVAIEYIQRLNNNGRRLRVHGINMSVGYSYDPEWFACGQSPLCVEVNRLVRSGVVVVVAAGNTGYGWLQAAFKQEPVAAGMDLSINDPGNADLAITVGSTHRESPHLYGVSYFSSKGPTGDGRMKPDIVAPGEKILSCAAGEALRTVEGKPGDAVYVEDSGTSMAAPHVSGAIAAFLSVRNEFIGRSEDVKAIILSTATDLKRERGFQGHGLVDLMRALQAI